MKKILSLSLVIISFSAHSFSYYCYSINNPYDEYYKETDMVLISGCFNSVRGTEFNNKVCQREFSSFFPTSTKEFIRRNVTAEYFVFNRSCINGQEEMLSFAQEPYSQGYQTQRIYEKLYFIINTY